ncbi:type II secretion system F family protein [Peptococcaceae bacterium]|nr:type II secretion system F family protein [Peptococcaceae bacterium]
MLDKAAEYYEQEVDVTVSKLSSTLEPLLIVGLGIVVGFIILSVILPTPWMLYFPVCQIRTIPIRSFIFICH